jgi:hypothetical protein
MLDVVAPVDHKRPPVVQALAVKVVELPEHTFKLLPEATEIVGAVGVGFTVAVTAVLLPVAVSQFGDAVNLHPT